MLLNIHDHVESWTIGMAHHLPHTWVMSWTGPHAAALRDDALTAGWDWKLVDEPTHRPIRWGRDKHFGELADDRLAIEPDSTGIVANLSAIALDSYYKSQTPGWQPPQRTLLAVGTGFNGHSPDLHQIARFGPSAGIHLAVSTALAQPGRAPQQFTDNIRGYWERSSVTMHPSGGVSIRVKNTRSNCRERFGNTVTISLDADGAVARIDLTAGVIVNIDQFLDRYPVSQPMAQLLRNWFSTT
ncbi:MAG: hypothetical protein J2P17_28580 [Mycobacterium sp.]|nr:hypothetical protein [Mycobacterium sp.]